MALARGREKAEAEGGSKGACLSLDDNRLLHLLLNLLHVLDGCKGSSREEQGGQKRDGGARPLAAPSTRTCVPSRGGRAGAGGQPPQRSRPQGVRAPSWMLPRDTMISHTQVGSPSATHVTFSPASASACAYSTSGRPCREGRGGGGGAREGRGRVGGREPGSLAREPAQPASRLHSAQQLRPSPSSTTHWHLLLAWYGSRNLRSRSVPLFSALTLYSARLRSGRAATLGRDGMPAARVGFGRGGGRGEHGAGRACTAAMNEDWRRQQQPQQDHSTPTAGPQREPSAPALASSCSSTRSTPQASRFIVRTGPPPMRPAGAGGETEGELSERR